MSEKDKDLKAIWPTNSIALPYVIMKFSTSGDCCNSVWIESFENIDCLINSSILFVESKDWETIEGGDDSVLEAAFWTIKTSKGYTDFEVRNSHNGYYGGSLSFSGLYTSQSDFKLFQKELDSQYTKNQKILAVLQEKLLIEEKVADFSKKMKSIKI